MLPKIKRFGQNAPMEWTSNSPEETMALGKKLFNEFPDATVVCLRGPLGSGKTCFAKGIGAALSIDPTQIKSPSFTTLFEYDGDQKLYHFDFYRYEKPEDVDANWWMDVMERDDGIVVAEWAERIEPHLPQKRVEIEMIDLGDDRRKFILKSHS